jgi:cbb3-type cytochrome c oxidase subunit III
MVKKKKQVKTTGHIFDGIEEYNNRLPKWWKIVFVACIFIALTYALFYPSIPTHKGFFKGLSGWTSHNVLNKDLEKVKETRKVYYEKIKTSSFDEIKKDPQLKEFAYDDAVVERAKNHGALAGNLHTDMHEVIGHASGKINEGISTPDVTLKNYANEKQTLPTIAMPSFTQAGS